MAALETNEPIKHFLSQFLGHDQFKIIPLAGDASARRYYRIVHEKQSCVLMEWEPFKDDENYPFLSVLNHFKKHHVNVPKIIHKDPTMGLVLLEDLGDLTLERKFWESQDQNLALPFYRLAVDEIIKIHYPASLDTNSYCTAFNIEFDIEKLMWELNYGKKHLIEKLAGIQLEHTKEKEVLSIFTDICTVLHNEPKVICHRDYHSRNLMITLDQMRVIDFQDARLGPVQYDLVSLVHDSYVNLNQQNINSILEYYLTEAKAYTKIERDHFFELMNVQLIQRCFKACGSFASFYNMRGDRRYLKYVTPTLKKLSSCLKQFPKYSAFANIIHELSLRDFNK